MKDEPAAMLDEPAAMLDETVDIDEFRKYWWIPYLLVFILTEACNKTTLIYI